MACGNSTDSGRHTSRSGRRESAAVEAWRWASETHLDSRAIASFKSRLSLWTWSAAVRLSFASWARSKPGAPCKRLMTIGIAIPRPCRFLVLSTLRSRAAAHAIPVACQTRELAGRVDRESRSSCRHVSDGHATQRRSARSRVRYRPRAAATPAIFSRISSHGPVDVSQSLRLLW